MSEAVQKLLLVIAVISFFFSGCASQSGSTQKADMSDWELVPRVWVEDTPGSQYDDCSFDNESDGYLCPPGTK
jgi:hypothetical protein